jgi:hypothetical protein
VRHGVEADQCLHEFDELVLALGDGVAGALLDL